MRLHQRIIRLLQGHDLNGRTVGVIGLAACVAQAAGVYHIPPAYIETVLRAPHPADGVGPMGIPPAWLPTLARYGFDASMVVSQQCANVAAGAWIIAENPKASVSSVHENGSLPQEAPKLPECAVEAADAYNVPRGDIQRVLAAKHPAGSLGPMGVPEAWLGLLVQDGFNSYLVQHDPCMGMTAGIWILGVEQLQMANLYEDGASDAIARASRTPPTEFLPFFAAAATRYSIPESWLLAVASQESDFDPRVTSPAGAMGLMQLMPATAADKHVVDPYDPEQSIMGGADYLAQLRDQFGGNLPLVLAAYNAGSQAVIEYGGKIPPFQETQNYVPEVLGKVKYYEGEATSGHILAQPIPLASIKKSPSPVKTTSIHIPSEFGQRLE